MVFRPVTANSLWNILVRLYSSPYTAL